MAYFAGYWLVQELRGIDPKLHERPGLIYAVGTLLFGAQLMSIGFLAELIIAYQGRDADTYSIADRVGDFAAEETNGHEPVQTTLSNSGRKPASDDCKFRSDSPGTTPAAIAADDPQAALRRGVYAILIAVSVGAMLGRISPSITSISSAWKRP